MYSRLYIPHIEPKYNFHFCMQMKFCFFFSFEGNYSRKQIILSVLRRYLIYYFVKYQVVTFVLYLSNPIPKMKINNLNAYEIIDDLLCDEYTLFLENCTAMDLEIMFCYVVFQPSIRPFRIQCRQIPHQALLQLLNLLYRKRYSSGEILNLVNWNITRESFLSGNTIIICRWSPFQMSL